MTTLADRIADFETQANQLLDLPQQIADTAAERIDEIGDYWDARVAGMFTRVWVDQGSGDDAAAGTADAPLKSLGEALRRTPPGGVCEVRLAADYHIAQDETVRQTYLRLTSDGSVRHTVTVERTTATIANTAYRRTTGLWLRERAAVEFSGLTLVVPPLDGNWDNYTPRDVWSGLVFMRDTSSSGNALVKLRNCDVSVPSSPFCAVIGHGADYPLELHAYSLVATDQPLTGHLLSGATDTNGTDTATLPWLLTNLTTV